MLNLTNKGGNMIGKTVNDITNEYEKEHVEQTDIDIFNFSFEGEIEFDSPLLFGSIHIEISNGKIMDIDSINHLHVLNRENESIKIYFDPNYVEKSICKFLLFNTENVKDFLINASWEAFKKEIECAG